MKAALDDLVKWRKIAMRGKALKASSFISAYIPKHIMAKVKKELTTAKTQDDIAAVFDRAAAGMKKSSNNDPLWLLATELEKANELLASAS